MTTHRFLGAIGFDTADGRGVPVATIDGARFIAVELLLSGTVRITYNDDDNAEQTFDFDPGSGGGGGGNPVISGIIDAAGTMLTLQRQTGTVEITIPEILRSGGGGGGADQVARDAADAAQAEIDAHEGATHNTDTVARNRATTARNEAQSAQDDIDAHEVGHPTQRVLNQDPNADADTLGKFQIDPQGNAYTTTPDTEHGTAQDPPTSRGSPTLTTSGSFRASRTRWPRPSAPIIS